MSDNIYVKDFNSQSAVAVQTSATNPGSPDTEVHLPHHNLGGGKYETIAASQSDQVLGGAGAVGDVLATLVIVPATTGAGTVSIKDGSGSGINVFVTGTLADLRPIVIPLWIKSTSGAW